MTWISFTFGKLRNMAVSFCIKQTLPWWKMLNWICIWLFLEVFFLRTISMDTDTTILSTWYFSWSPNLLTLILYPDILFTSKRPSSSEWHSNGFYVFIYCPEGIFSICKACDCLILSSLHCEIIECVRWWF
jgi:hypothetical protein